MKRILSLLLLSASLVTNSVAQTGIGTTTPASSAALDVSSTNKGFLPPRMTWTQIQAIPNPTPGLLVYDTGIDAIRMYTRNGWVTLMPASGSASDAPGNFGSIQQAQFGGSIYVHSVKMDASNNVFVAGHYFIAPSIGNTTFPAASGSNSDAFFAKFDASGNLVLLKTFGSTGNDEINCIAVDGLGNIHIGGAFNLTVDFDPSASATSLTSSGLEDGFYARYDAAGNFSFVKKIGGTGNESVEGMAYDASNAMFICGSFSSATVSVNGTSLSLAGGAADGFVASYNILNGNNNWVKQVGGTGNETVKNVASNSPALVYGCGSTNSASLTVAGAGPYGLLGNSDGFVLALNGGSGSLNTMLQVGDAGEVCGVNDVAVDVAGNYYYGGSFSGTVDLNPFGGTSNSTSSGSSDGFIVKISSGNAFQFARTMGGSGGDVVTSVAANNLGYPYATGYFAGTASFSGILPALSKVSEGSFDIFLAHYHSGGNLLWLTTAGSLNGETSSVLDVNAAGTLLYDAVQMQGNNYRAFNGTRISNAGVFYLARYEQ